MSHLFWEALLHSPKIVESLGLLYPSAIRSLFPLLYVLAGLAMVLAPRSQRAGVVSPGTSVNRLALTCPGSGLMALWLQ